MTKQTLLMMIGAFGALGGCASTHTASAPDHWKDQSHRYEQLDRETERLIRSIEGALVILSETRVGERQIESTPDEMRAREWLFKVTPPGMGVPMTVPNLRTHPKTIIDMIAATTGYVVESIGNPSSETRNVSISVISRPAVEILRSVSMQMGCDGLVDVLGAQRKIVLDWTLRKRGACK